MVLNSFMSLRFKTYQASRGKGLTTNGVLLSAHTHKHDAVEYAAFRCRSKRLHGFNTYVVQVDESGENRNIYVCTPECFGDINEVFL